MHEALKLARLRREIRKGLDQIERGKVVDGGTFFAKWDQNRKDRLE